MSLEPESEVESDRYEVAARSPAVGFSGMSSHRTTSAMLVSTERDLNPRPRPCKSPALAKLSYPWLVVTSGIEPVPLGLQPSALPTKLRNLGVLNQI